MTIIHDTPAAALRRLAELGVAPEAIQSAVVAGHVARITCTENDPPFIPGTEAWRMVVVTLRQELLPRGWRKADPGNFSLVINDARKINIVVASADGLTSRAHGSPRTNSLKGLYTEAATVRNCIESDFFPETFDDQIKAVAASLQYPTWVLLIFITDDEYRAELSLPEAMDDGQITEWRERIFIPHTPGSGGLSIEAPDSDEGAIDVPVLRRA